MTDLNQIKESTTTLAKDAEKLAATAFDQAVDAGDAVKVKVSDMANKIAKNATNLNSYILEQINSHPYVALGIAAVCGWVGAKICNNSNQKKNT
jgi:hypothetical protein